MAAREDGTMDLDFFQVNDVTCIRFGPLYGCAVCHEEDKFNPKVGIVVAILKSYPVFSPITEHLWPHGATTYTLRKEVAAYLLTGRIRQAECEAVLRERGLGHLIGQARLNKAKHMVKMLDYMSTWRIS